jgi:hypothetical protein
MSHEPIKLGYRTAIICIMSGFGAAAMYYVNRDPEAVADVLWTLGVVFVAILGRSALPLTRRNRKDVDGE